MREVEVWLRKGENEVQGKRGNEQDCGD